MLINSLGLKNFKCFEELNVDFRPITLLTGANSSGKSSLINAILAVMQTSEFPIYLSPNGKYVNMGSFDEMLSWAKKDKIIDINVVLTEDSHKQEVYQTSWHVNRKNNLPELHRLYSKDRHDEFAIKSNLHHRYVLNAEVLEHFLKSENTYEKVFGENNVETILVDDYASILKITNSSFKSFDELLKITDAITVPNIQEYFFTYSFNYIGSFRLPPERTYYQKPKAQDTVGISGEGYVDQIVEWEENNSAKFKILAKHLRDIKLFEEIKSTKLKGGRFELAVKTTHESLSASLTDVGFGVSQFLPIIVADLQLRDNSCLAVSQPEIHLHPKIQAQFGNYLANQVNSTQKQYIIETHSEYLLNRIRLLLVTGELKPEQVRVLYFENDGLKSTSHTIEFATDGSVKGAPESFFDTYGIDVMNIAMEAIG